MSKIVTEDGGLSPKHVTPRREAGVGATPMPPKRWRLLIVSLAAGLVVAAALAWRAYQRAEALGAEVVLAEAQLERAEAVEDEYHRLLRADVHLFTGDYREARAAYDRLVSDTSRYGAFSDGTIERRLDHLGLLTSYLLELDTLRELAGRPPREVLVRLPAEPVARALAPLPLEASKPGEYDSLNFALRKAEMRIRSLEGRLRQRSGGNYLTFESSQGNDVYYVGDVRDGRADGRGVALLSSGSRYRGEWRDNRRHGEGTFHWPDGAYYEGQYVDDERDGRGTYHFPDGSMFVGEWEADLRNGEGIFYDKDGEVVARGRWDDDELVERRPG